MSNYKIRKSQDGSAYWYYVMNGPHQSLEGHFPEQADANPDSLAEEDTLIQKSELTDEQEEQVSEYYKAIARGVLRKLPTRQRQIWKLRFFKWCSEEEIMEQLNLSLSTVRTHLSRAAEKIKQEIEKQQKKKAMLNGNYFNDGFKKRLDSRGASSIDAEFSERLERAQPEIDAFVKKHPELKKGNFNEQ